MSEENNNSNGIDKATYNAAQMAVAKYREEVQKKDEELSLLRATNLEKETQILKLDNQVQQLEAEKREKDLLISRLTFVSNNDKESQQNKNVSIDDISFKHILKE